MYLLLQGLHINGEQIYPVFQFHNGHRPLPRRVGQPLVFGSQTHALVGYGRQFPHSGIENLHRLSCILRHDAGHRDSLVVFETQRPGYNRSDGHGHEDIRDAPVDAAQNNHNSKGQHRQSKRRPVGKRNRRQDHIVDCLIMMLGLVDMHPEQL